MSNAVMSSKADIVKTGSKKKKHTTEEKKFENRIKYWLKQQGIWYVKYHSNFYTKKGVPDILGCLPTGLFMAHEVKSEEGKPTPEQIEQLEQIMKNHGYATVVHPSEWELVQSEILQLIG